MHVLAFESTNRSFERFLMNSACAIVSLYRTETRLLDFFQECFQQIFGGQLNADLISVTIINNIQIGR